MRHYEIVIIVHPNQSAKMSDILAKYKNTITKDGGTVHRLEDWGRRILAYPINKAYKGHYALMNIECSQDVLDTLNYNFRFNDVILRNLVISTKEAITEKSAILKQMEADKEIEKKQG